MANQPILILEAKQKTATTHKDYTNGIQIVAFI